MSVSLLEVLESAGYDFSTIIDAQWLLSKQPEFDELIEQAHDLIDEAEDYYDEVV